KALAQAHYRTRNATGFWLACQLRDNRYDRHEAESAMRAYAASVGQEGHPYTEGEALASLRSAYLRPAREPWHVGYAYSRGSEKNGAGNGNPSEDSNGNTTAPDTDTVLPLTFSNFREKEIGQKKPKTVKVGRSVTAIGQELLRRTGGWPKRVGPLLF